MNEPRVDEVVRVLERVGREASALVLEGYRRGVAVRKKGDIDLVTEYDLASEALITRELSRAFPQLAIVGEEAADSNAPGTSELACYVDPIDGTTNFAHGHPFFAVSLGLCRGGEPVAGVICAPALDVCWSGIVGQGVTRNGEPCQVSTRAPLADALCATGFGYDVVGSQDDNIAEFQGIQARCRAVRRCGAAALDLALVADGTYDAYWEFLLRPWDLAAGAALVLAAGGKATSFEGTPLDVRTGAVIASNGLVHEQLTTCIRALRNARPVPTR